MVRRATNQEPAGAGMLRAAACEREVVPEGLFSPFEKQLRLPEGGIARPSLSHDLEVEYVSLERA